jgi:hypothetical protein
MKLFATLFAVISLALIPTVFANESLPAPATHTPSIQQSIGRADIDNAQAQTKETTSDLILDGRTIVTTDFGGSVVEYITKYNRWRLEGRKVAVTDDCMSACTFILGRVPASNVCVTDNAQFAFHSAYQMTFGGPVFAKEATRLMWQYYPEAVKVKLREAGWESGEVPHPDFIYVKATEFYELCD